MGYRGKLHKLHEHFRDRKTDRDACLTDNIRDLSVGDSAATRQAAESGNVPTSPTCTVTQFWISDSLIVDSHYYLGLLQYTIVITIISLHTDMQTDGQRSTVMLGETISCWDRFYFALPLGAPLRLSARQTRTASTCPEAAWQIVVQ